MVNTKQELTRYAQGRRKEKERHVACKKAVGFTTLPGWPCAGT